MTSVIDYILAGICAVLGIACIVLFIQKTMLKSDLAECELNFNTLTTSVEAQNAEIESMQANNEKLNQELASAKVDLGKSYATIALPQERVENEGFNPERACEAFVTDLLDNIYERRN